MSRVTADILFAVNRRFREFGFPLEINRNIIPPGEDESTLFVCSGIQPIKKYFTNPDPKRLVHGSLQACIRTNDLEAVGDGQHLSYFSMLGNFAFNSVRYVSSCKMWDLILKDLSFDPNHLRVNIHPSQVEHKKIWCNLGYTIVGDESCKWTDGDIGGFCCEVYYRGHEIGNLVNTLGHSTDVGFGFERMVQALENKVRIDETSLFDQELTPVAQDHSRALKVMRENSITPGNKGRAYVCRRLLRRLLRHLRPYDVIDGLMDWITNEQKALANRMLVAKRSWKDNHDKPIEWWWDTHGILPEEWRDLSA